MILLKRGIFLLSFAMTIPQLSHADCSQIIQEQIKQFSENPSAKKELTLTLKVLQQARNYSQNSRTKDSARSDEFLAKLNTEGTPDLARFIETNHDLGSIDAVASTLFRGDQASEFCDTQVPAKRSRLVIRGNLASYVKTKNSQTEDQRARASFSALPPAAVNDTALARNTKKTESVHTESPIPAKKAKTVQ